MVIIGRRGLAGVVNGLVVQVKKKVRIGRRRRLTMRSPGHSEEEEVRAMRARLLGVASREEYSKGGLRINTGWVRQMRPFGRRRYGFAEQRQGSREVRNRRSRATAVKSRGHGGSPVEGCVEDEMKIAMGCVAVACLVLKRCA